MTDRDRRDELTMNQLVEYVTDETTKVVVRRIESREQTAKIIGRGCAWMGFWIGLGIFLAATW